MQDKIKQLRSKGYTNREIAVILECSLYTISKATAPRITPLGQQIIDLRSQGKTLKEISEYLKISKSTASKWASFDINNNELIRTNTKNGYDRRRTNILQPIAEISMNIRMQSNRKLRNQRREYLVNAAGGKCHLCGYNKCQAALEFHHVDPLTKLFNISGSRISNRTMESLILEANKCALVCSNCHAEIHNMNIRPNKTVNIDLKYPAYLDRVSVELTDDMIKNEKNWITNRLQLRELKQREDIDINLNDVCVRLCDKSITDVVYDDYHYLGRSNKSGINLGIYIGDTLLGGCLITNPVRQQILKGVCEISRFVLKYNFDNLASKSIALIIKYLKSNHEYKYVQAYAQSDIHNGSIYKACNFGYVSVSRPTYNYNNIHKKTIYERAATIGLSEYDYAKLFELTRYSESGKIKFVRKI